MITENYKKGINIFPFLFSKKLTEYYIHSGGYVLFIEISLNGYNLINSRGGTIIEGYSVYI